MSHQSLFNLPPLTVPSVEVKLLDRGLYEEGDALEIKRTDAGLDLRARESVWVPEGEAVMVPLGIAISIPVGYVGLLLPRSGLGTQGLILGNGTGVIDAGYHGEIQACMWNRTRRHKSIARADRICQLVIVPHLVVGSFVPVDKFTVESERGEDGFGSTGIK